MNVITDAMINASVFILAWLNIGIHNVALDEGKQILNCKEATISRDVSLKLMERGTKGWSTGQVYSNTYRVTKQCGGSYTTLVTKLDKDTYMFEHRGIACEKLRKNNKPCWNTRKIK